MITDSGAVSARFEDAPLTRFHVRLALFSSGGPFLDGYVLGIIAVALVQLVPRWHINSFWSGMLGASALIGVFIGGLGFGYLTDRVGRRLMYTIDLLAVVVLSVAQFFVGGVVWLFVLRLVIGVAIGADYPISTALVTEFAPSRWRAKLVGGLNAVWFVGAVVAAFVGWALLGVHDGWRWMLLSSAVPAVLIIIGRQGFPESPRWLASKGRRDEALGIVQQILGPGAGIDDIPDEDSGVGLRCLLDSGYLRRTVFVGVFWSCTVITLFAIYAFGPEMLTLMHLSSGNDSNLGYGLINVFFLIGNIVALALVDRLGRRVILIWGFGISALGLLFLGVAPSAPLWAITIGFAIYAIFNGGPSILEWIYPNELFPTEIRATAVGIGTAISRLGAAAGTWGTPWALAHWGISAVMLIAAGIAIVGALVGIVMAPETRAQRLDEAARVGSSSISNATVESPVAVKVMS